MLVTRATGKQGRAVVSALLSAQAGSPQFHILALTRNANSARAQSLAKKPNVSITEGDLDDSAPIFRKAAQPINGVFGIQTPLKPAVEERQGKDLVEAAVANGVKHFIYTSSERGGLEQSDADGTPITHFISKFNIENHLKAVTAKNHSSMVRTIIRPVAFMENLMPNFLGKTFATMWRMNGTDSKLQLTSSIDIGILAADAFRNQEQYGSKAISFATEELTYTEANEIFKRVAGKDMPTTYHFVGRIIKYLLHDQLGLMFNWFKDLGFGANPTEFTTKFPQIQSFERWLKESSKFRQQT